MTRAPALPLWTGKAVSANDYRALVADARLEHEDQAKLIGELRCPALTLGPVVAFAVPNDFAVPGVPRWITARVWRALQARGALAGATDLVILHRGVTLFCEVKRAKGGRLSEDQKTFRDSVRLAGGMWLRFDGYEDARRQLTERGILRGR